ncbi:MAG: hypothetical protein IKO73_09350 [Bacteroidaceae bacterium]|nr:hypothetical protein [Bacteroidaceae bacterium]
MKAVIMISDKTYKILKLLEKGTYLNGICAKWISWKLWGGNPATEHMSYTRKGWLQVGSQIGKLRKKGLVNYDKEFTGYYLTREGIKAIEEYEKS